MALDSVEVLVYRLFSVDAATSYTNTTTVNVRGTQTQSAKNFSVSDVDVSNNRFTITGHGLETEDEIEYATTGSNVGGLTEPNKYFIIKIDANTVQVASTIDDAAEGSNISISGGGSGTHTFTPTENARVTSNKNNLIFKLDIRGQQGNIGGEGNDTEDFACSYSKSIFLLHGGEGWETGDTVRVSMDQAKGRSVTGTTTSGTGGRSGLGEAPATYVIEVTEHETITVKANLKLVRPEPTPFDADTAVSADQVLGGILSELPTGINGTIIGNGIYLSSNSSFNCEIVEDDLMRSMGTSVNDVTLLPKQCKLLNGKGSYFIYSTGITKSCSLDD